MADELRTTELHDLLGRVAARDRTARDELVRRTAGNLDRLTRRMLADYPTVRRWEEADDVVQNATLRLLRALEAVTPEDTRQFFGLAAEQIRRELIDLARHYSGPHGIGANHASQPGTSPGPDPAAPESGSLADWQTFHEAVAGLSEADREVFDLLYYQGLRQAEAADLLGLTEAAVQQRWQRARLRLYERLKKRPEPS
jgi:RNA polymerase sigma-70 factor (ECF subfamily)